MRILLIGGTGTISMEISRQLLALGHELYLVNRGSRNAGLAAQLPDGSWNRPKEIRVDIAEEKEAAAKLEGLSFDAVADFIAFDVEALKRDPSTGAIQWNAARCIHCGRCVVSCPLGNIRLSPSRGSLIKCDLCGGAPSCAAVCPVAAIDFLEVNDEMDEQTMVFDQGRGGH